MTEKDLKKVKLPEKKIPRNKPADKRRAILTRVPKIVLPNFRENCLTVREWWKKKQLYLKETWKFSTGPAKSSFGSPAKHFCRRAEIFLLQIHRWLEEFGSFEAKNFRKKFLRICRRQFAQRWWKIFCHQAEKDSTFREEHTCFWKISLKKFHWTRKIQFWQQYCRKFFPKMPKICFNWSPEKKKLKLSQ